MSSWCKRSTSFTTRLLQWRQLFVAITMNQLHQVAQVFSCEHWMLPHPSKLLLLVYLSVLSHLIISASCHHSINHLAGVVDTRHGQFTQRSGKLDCWQTQVNIYETAVLCVRSQTHTGGNNLMCSVVDYLVCRCVRLWQPGELWVWWCAPSCCCLSLSPDVSPSFHSSSTHTDTQTVSETTNLQNNLSNSFKIIIPCKF